MAKRGAGSIFRVGGKICRLAPQNPFTAPVFGGRFVGTGFALLRDVMINVSFHSRIENAAAKLSELLDRAAATGKDGPFSELIAARSKQAGAQGEATAANTAAAGRGSGRGVDVASSTVPERRGGAAATR